MTTVDQAPDTAHGAAPAENERTVRRTVAREFRPRRSVPAIIVAALLALAAILVAIEVISQLIDRPLGLLPLDDLARLGRETQWNDPLTFVVAGLACLLGLLLLFLAFWPGRTRATALAGEHPGVVEAIGSTDLQRLAVQAAESVNGVERAEARTGRARIAVRADSPLHDPGDLDDQVQRAVSERLDELALLRPPQIRVHVRSRKD